MCRLNSGIKDRLNFFAWAIYIFQKIVSDSVNHADSGDIKIFVQFPGNSISKIFENAWVAPIFVGVQFSKSPNMLVLLRWTFPYVKLGVFI